MKVRFKSFTKGTLETETFQSEKISVSCNDDQKREMNKLYKYLSENSIFNLLGYKQDEEGLCTVDLIVLEPDYLIDISTLAECYKPFGNHPLNYTLSRFRIQENTSHILLGNTANFFIDELVNETKESPVSYQTALKKLFKIYPFEITSCENLQQPDTAKKFFDSCKIQFENIKHVIKKIFPQENIDTEKIILEPSFICNALGLQGRLDIMLQDFSAFVELKSGKGVEDFRTKQYKQSCVNHYTQMILYLAVLEYNMNLKGEELSSYLLYSKYPVLSKEAHSQKHLQEVISLRNTIVALDYAIQKENNTDFTRRILEHINPGILNTNGLSGKFYENYLLPQIDKLRIQIDSLTSLEQAYFFRLYTFIVKELWKSKLGEREYEGVKRAGNLWPAPTSEKIAAGELLYDLKMTDNQADTDEHFVSFSIPEYENFYLPNFRVGDAVVLYEKKSEEDNVNNKQVLKGAIESLIDKQIKIRIRAKQRNLSILPHDSVYAIEHDYPDTVFNGMFSSLHLFTQANQERKDLLLGLRNPEFNTSLLVQDENDDISRVASKAMATKDCFLLLGPPGTGKTSLALKKITELCIEKETGNVLLMAYTNRAVDEICKTLQDIDEKFSFIRIGSELNCAPEYRNNLLDKQLDKCDKRSDVYVKLSQCKVFVGTVASVLNKPGLFALIQFDMAIIDEAAQLLESHLIGILCAKDKKGKNSISRFVLIGDYKQLPAIVLQSKEECQVKDEMLRNIEIKDMSCSLFERLYRLYQKNNQYLACDKLTKQGRMHPAISSFSSLFFYEGQLNPVGLSHQNEIMEQDNKYDNEWEDIVKNKRLAFIPSQKTTNDISDKVNHVEAENILSIVKAIYEKEVEFNPSKIGIITPYRSQIALIKKILLKSGMPHLSQIAIDTVERFQGSQKDIIIYSFCVNSQWQLKTLPNITEESGKLIDRKLNVVLTRARKQLFITGNPYFLTQDFLFGSLIKYIENQYDKS